MKEIINKILSERMRIERIADFRSENISEIVVENQVRIKDINMSRSVAVFESLDAIASEFLIDESNIEDVSRAFMRQLENSGVSLMSDQNHFEFIDILKTCYAYNNQNYFQQ